MGQRTLDTEKRMIQARILNVPIVANILRRCYRYVAETV
jgi:hypothetical protein